MKLIKSSGRHVLTFFFVVSLVNEAQARETPIRHDKAWRMLQHSERQLEKLGANDPRPMGCVYRGFSRPPRAYIKNGPVEFYGPVELTRFLFGDWRYLIGSWDFKSELEKPTQSSQSSKMGFCRATGTVMRNVMRDVSRMGLTEYAQTQMNNTWLDLDGDRPVKKANGMAFATRDLFSQEPRSWETETPFAYARCSHSGDKRQPMVVVEVDQSKKKMGALIKSGTEYYMFSHIPAGKVRRFFVGYKAEKEPSDLMKARIREDWYAFEVTARDAQGSPQGMNVYKMGHRWKTNESDKNDKFEVWSIKQRVWSSSDKNNIPTDLHPNLVSELKKLASLF